MLNFTVAGHVFTGDTLFKNSIGGVRAPGSTSYADIKASIMDTLMGLDHDTEVHPGHTDPTTIGDEWENNAFIRVWRGLDPEGDEQVTVQGEPATLVVWGDDYDGGHKAWVRWPDGRDDIVPGSQVERAELDRTRDMAKKDAIPTSRLSRSSKVGRLAATQAAKQMGTRATNVARSRRGQASRRSPSASSRPPSRSSPRWGR